MTTYFYIALTHQNKFTHFLIKLHKIQRIF